MYKFGKRSLSKLETVHPVLQEVMKEAIKRSPVDFSITEGQRSTKRQLELYKAGKSKIDGVRKKSKHNYEPALAIDFMPIVNGKGTFSNMSAIDIVSGVIMSTAISMGVQVRWGGTFGSKTWRGWDKFHVELVGNPPLTFEKKEDIVKEEPKKSFWDRLFS